MGLKQELIMELAKRDLTIVHFAVGLAMVIVFLLIVILTAIAIMLW